MVALGGRAWLLGGHAWLLGGHAWFYLGGMRGFIQGACMVLLGGMRGFIWGGVHGFFSFFRYNEIQSMSRQYASYWNAFLFSIRTSTWAPTLRGRGAPTYDFAKFSQKLHEIERIRTPRGACVSRVPFRCATDYVLKRKKY